MEKVKKLSEEEFETEIKSGVTLVDFYAEWCGPCRMMSPVIEEVAGELDGKASFGKVDIDKSNKAASSFQVTSVPTLILFKDGKEVDRVVGLRDTDELKTFVSAAL